MTAVEFRGSTSTDKLAPPSIDPSKLSQGYTYKAPGKADPLAPRRWEVGTFQFSPSFVTAYLDDSIMLSVFIADGDHHDVQLTDPEGRVVIARRHGTVAANTRSSSRSIRWVITTWNALFTDRQ